MYLLDTNVVSELRKVRLCKADANVARWADTVDASELYLSVISIQELEIGVRLHVPNPQPVRDGLIVATALVHGMTVVTRNVADFERTGVKLLNPWESLSK